MLCGIYEIRNQIDNKVYIGSSINLGSRKYKHFWMLINERHDNVHLQRSFDLYKKENFIFNIIEECDEKYLVDRENFYIEIYKSNQQDFGYNLATVNEFRRNNYNDEVKIKLSKYNLMKNNNFTTFSLINMETNIELIFESLVDGANYLIKNGFANGKPSYVRLSISNCLRGVKVNNGHKGTIRKTCYKHKFKIIN